MNGDVLDQLRSENPVPDRMPTLPIEPVLARVDLDSATAERAIDVSSRRSRRVLRVVPLVVSFAVVCVVAGVLLSAGRSNHQAPSTGPTGPSTPSGHASGSSATMAGRYLLDFLFPTSGEEQAASGRLTAFAIAVKIKAVTACMAAKSLPGPPIVYGAPPLKFGSIGLPNMPLIQRAGNVGVTTVRGSTNPARALSPARLHVYDATLRTCDAEASINATSPLAENPEELVNAWMKIQANVFASAPVRAANRKAAACSQHTPFPATTVGGEQQAIEAKLTPLFSTGHDAQARAVNASGARVLVRCFGAVEMLRTRLLAAQRAKFFAQHRGAINDIQRRAARVVAADEANYGIKLGAVPAGSVPTGIGPPPSRGSGTSASAR